MKQQTTEGRTHSSVFLKLILNLKKIIKFPIFWFCMLLLRTSDFQNTSLRKKILIKLQDFASILFVYIHNIIFAYCKILANFAYIHDNLCMHKYVGSYSKKKLSQILYWVALPLKLQSNISNNIFEFFNQKLNVS